MSHKRARGSQRDVNMSQAASSSSSAYAGQRGNGFDSAIIGVPNSRRTTLLYADTLVLGSGVGTTAQHVFRLNSLFDPDYTGVGHQPRYFDQFAALFNRYRVDEVYIEMTLSTTSNMGAVVILNADNSLGGVGVASALELPNTSAPITVQADNSKTLRFRVSPAKVTGVSKAHYMDDRFSSVVTTNPAEAIGLSVSTLAADNLTTGINVNVSYRMAFKCEFYDRIAIGGS
ncbi:MAG: putative capsid protein [Cressdnaviricota sp.]|nr:MAG: putative capsid protein [Cressdnaviricota sp.]